MILCTTCGKEIELKQQISSLKSQLANIKYLNADEVKVLTRGLVTEIKYYDDLFSDPNCPNTNHKEIEENLISLFIKDICNLAIPDIDRDRIAEEIEHESMNLIGVIHEIIQRCFIDYEKLPKANDIKGKL